jgi:hypothetical protein
MFMFDITPPFEMSIISLQLSVSEIPKQRYCPVLTPRGRPAQYLHFHDKHFPAFVAPDESSANDSLYDLDDLHEYLKSMVPKLEEEDLDSLVAFHEVTDVPLPVCLFMTGELLMWNDVFLARNHEVRVCIGEGPFLVTGDNSYLVAVPTENGQKPVLGNDQLVLYDLHNQKLIIAHGGLFKAIKKQRKLYYQPATAGSSKMVLTRNHRK